SRRQFQFDRHSPRSRSLSEGIKRATLFGALCEWVSDRRCAPTCRPRLSPCGLDQSSFALTKHRPPPSSSALIISHTNLSIFAKPPTVSAGSVSARIRGARDCCACRVPKRGTSLLAAKRAIAGGSETTHAE